MKALLTEVVLLPAMGLGANDLTFQCLFPQLYSEVNNGINFIGVTGDYVK